MKRSLVTIFCASAAVMLLETTSIRIYSFALWYHMVPFIIGGAMAAFAASTLLQTAPVVPVSRVHIQRRSWMPDTVWWLSSAGVFIADILVRGITGALHYQQRFVQNRRTAVIAVEGLLSLVGLRVLAAELFVPSRILVSAEASLGFIVTALAMAAPYFFLGSIINIILASDRGKGNLYAADMAGCALGALAGLGAITTVGPVVGYGLAGILIFVVLALHLSWRLAVPAAAATAIIVAVVAITPLPLFAGKNRSAIPGYSPAAHGKVLDVCHSMLATLHIVSSADTLDRSDQVNLIIDGDASTQIRPWDGEIQKLGDCNKNLYSAPYQIMADMDGSASPADVCIIGPGGGREVRAALVNGFRVCGAEINPDIVTAVSEHYADFAGDLYNRPDVNIACSEGRYFLTTSDQNFDVIQLALVDTWAASATGAIALSENGLYTVEAFETFFSHLSGDGVLAISRWHRSTQPQRLCSVGYETLRRQGISDPARHICLLQNSPPEFLQDSDRGSLSQGIDPGVTRDLFLLKQSPWTAEQGAVVERVCRDRGWYVRYADWMDTPDPVIEGLVNPARHQATVASADKNLAASTDDRPYFFQEEHPRTIIRGFLSSRRHFGSGYSGVATLILGALLLGVVALVIIGAHCLISNQQGLLRPAGWLLAYNVFLGLGFMFIEIPLTYRLSLLLGNVVLSFVVTVPGLIIAVAIGAAISDRIRSRPAVCLGGMAVIVAMVAGMHFGWSSLHATLIGWDIIPRTAVTAAVVLITGIPLGVFVPAGLTEASRRDLEGAIPMIWGSNLAMSAAAPCLATAVSIFAGYPTTLWIAASMYLGSGLIGGFTFGKGDSA